MDAKLTSYCEKSTYRVSRSFTPQLRIPIPSGSNLKVMWQVASKGNRLTHKTYLVNTKAARRLSVALVRINGPAMCSDPRPLNSRGSASPPKPEIRHP